ncbi:MAG: DUF4954 family protein [Chitinophagaceae bacterium]
MNLITKHPLESLGYDFIASKYLPEGKNEYYLRDLQQGNMIQYRNLNAQEIETLVRNNNSSDNWNQIFVVERFNAHLVKNCHFFGKIRIGRLEPYYLEFHNLRLTVGLYNSTICSCDIGDNVVIENVAYLSHYIIGNEVIIANVNEMTTTDYAKFGNGILKEGEDENVRVWMELCNENGGRRVMPFEGMLPGDAYLWTRYRDDLDLMKKFKTFTQNRFDQKRGFYGMVGDRTVIKNCKIIKDTMIGCDAYLKGANKIKNLTINSSAEETSQIGEGCELVNGIIGLGCRVFYGVKAVRFIMGSHSSLKYGARLINSYLGSNSTVSCCEVLNSLIFPSHEQHHNNSFLCAALLMGQSNMAAGATIGSNHNSRGADGEIIAGRGFWPGLCVSLKHNSKFATFTLIAKGNYPAEINLELPFCLLVNEEGENRLKVMPGYWFMYNMYALARNSWKYIDRDKRKEKIQQIECDFLAPDSIEEMFTGLKIMELATAEAFLKGNGKDAKNSSELELKALGKDLLLNQPGVVTALNIILKNVENSSRPTQLLKAHQAYPIFRTMIRQYGVQTLVDFITKNEIKSLPDLLGKIEYSKRDHWVNLGGQLIPQERMRHFKDQIKNGNINSWTEIHQSYQEFNKAYPLQKLQHAMACLLEIEEITLSSLDENKLNFLLLESIKTKEWMARNISASRKKDYHNPFRKMVYDNDSQMETVIGKFSENSFIQQTKEDLKKYISSVQVIMTRLNSGNIPILK